MNEHTPCGYEWTIKLISQNCENALDKCLLATLNQVLGHGSAFAMYFSKSLSIRQHPCLIFNSGLLTSDDKSLNNVTQLDIPELTTRLTKLRQDVTVLNLAQAQVLPIRYQGLMLGFLVIDTKAKPSMTSTEYAVVSHILNVYVHQSATLHYARLDPLTQLLNRQTFDEKVVDIVSGNETWFMRDGYGERRWYMAIVDIDLFKKVNDTYGHVMGDEVILLVAQLLKSNFRVEDYVFRYGGEEFAVVFPCENEALAIETLDRVRHNIDQMKFPQVGNVTVSMGFVELEGDIQVADFVNRADKALYQSKQDGRNRVTAYSSLKEKVNSHQTGDIELF
ncbi:hypothetical protein PSECIP111951_01484 [Pseudoalteromonas holothuriae]|uniref:diguanylate cyclase n=1 Tax=Pseudoalteromonas holothuriae TaxID=2963714 RepID=A0A9W4W642_9GAMM|nr:MULTISPECIES: GGDEF domain-containing protein [unclassified Pseudoalteromonas]CAH9056551.1 hypothetical protein PSECIP111951_01484 [Pseudoalteromonas sp. CIP111951]CAH9063006.1 hypothetical protein PSECIP111854_03138 [Pseudoalteromonas sp. CIP111854]